MAQVTVQHKTDAAIQFAHQAERLSLLPHDTESDEAAQTTAVEAKFVTPRDAVVETANGERLPAVPLSEAQKLNQLKDIVEGRQSESKGASGGMPQSEQREAAEDIESAVEERAFQENVSAGSIGQPTDDRGKLGGAVPPSSTNPLFPPLPLYGPPSFMRNLQCMGFRITSFFLSLSFLAVIVLGSAFTSVPLMLRHIGLRLMGKNPDKRRPFHDEEVRRRKVRKEVATEFKRQRRKSRSQDESREESSVKNEDGYVPTEGGKDPIICDAGYYARRVGLDVEVFEVQTEDGFIITLWHVFDPKEYIPVSGSKKDYKQPTVFPDEQYENARLHGASSRQYKDGNRRYPVLLVHGLLQSAGAYCVNDDDSLAFFLCKSGYDVWLGNNRCGFKANAHNMLKYNDPRMWAWNIRQMGVMDLPALVSRVLTETGFEKLGLICHSQGTTQTFVALAKEQRPELGEKISVFCALAPAAYAGPLIGKMYFKFMRLISPHMFRMFFGIHAFIPFMLQMHKLMPGTLYGALGYRVFAFLFNWTDDRWERDLRDRMFQFSPVYVSSESMRWWLGRECFAKQKCILSTKEEASQEDEEDEEDRLHASGQPLPQPEKRRDRFAWYNDQAPPFAFWIAGSDDLVDGKRLLRRFERGREPHVKVVHSKIIDEYEHLDVIWAMDAIEQVGKEVREVIWRTASTSARDICRVPKGCVGIEPYPKEHSGLPPTISRSGIATKWL